ncbi:metal ABC transporter substrate-binding protein [Agarivorans sp. Toyoura001]|uniref:metal ABC transporter solute-binding protein, Zn/Mn family n=1 Tax=Agarivorans sp. Toyoura001 TaxID=2283141 RepID=UPI0010DAD3B1|nr:zinc ABC transporter substrate-binding protein [Agarivorans sp. Toyoura001]GDY26640.1 metal ABC transporter substrate-binding protein [Agarivorans sp. Toyoura001]
MIRRFIVSLTLSLYVLLPAISLAAPVKVVTSFSVLKDLVKQVGGEQIELTNLVGPNGDAHVYQPSPADAQAVAHADLLVINGLGFEGWMERLVEAADFQGLMLAATDGIGVIHLEEHDDEAEATYQDEHEAHHEGGAKHHDEQETHHEDDAEHHDEGKEDHHAHHHGEFDPHAWHSVINTRTYVHNILAALVKVSPENRAYFEENAARYLSQLKQLQTRLAAEMASVPANKRNVITSHDAFGYLAKDYGFHFTAPQGMSTEAEASAADVVNIIKQIRQQNIQAVFVENVSNPRLIEQIARETGVNIGGELYSDALASEDQAAGTYIGMMEHNISTLVNALK